MKPLLELLSASSTAVIAVAGVVHLFCFALLWLWYRHSRSKISSALDDFTRGIRHRSVLDRASHPLDQIDAFLADVSDVLETPERREEQVTLWQRIAILDEKRRYFSSLRFETCYNVCRSMIEAYPLLGILGTILAIGLVVLEGSGATAGKIVERFGQAIWSTCAGLVVAIILMLLNSLVEPSFVRLNELRSQTAAAVARVKRRLALAGREP
ncbi:MAG: MotA/TolQ/ExbB proton channel family protein [Planctomycetaceae bacterium]|jgi:biopolymer transport protein ExbB/TolQ